MLLSHELLFDLEASRVLTRLDGKPKSDLNRASEKLIAEIQTSGTSAGKSSPVNIVGFHNLGALFLFQAGELQQAEEVCCHAIRLCQTLAEEDSFPHWATHMIQPYLNLGRIAAATGRCEESLAIFRDVFRFVQHQDDLVIQGYRIPVSRFEELLGEDSTIGTVGAGVYVADSIRSFLSAEDYEGLFQFAESLASDPNFANGSFPYTTMEAKARALLGLNQLKDALNTLVKFVQRMSRDTTRYGSIYTLVADIYRKAAMTRDANKMLELAETYMRAVRTKSGFCPELLRTTHLIALQQLLLGEWDRAAMNARLVLETAQNLGDEVGQIKALAVLINSLKGAAQSSLSLTSDLTSLCAQLDSITRGTGYRYEQALGYVQLAETDGSLMQGTARAGLRQAHLRLATLNRAYVGKRKERLSTYLSALEQLMGETQSLEVEFEAPRQHVFHKLYDELLALEPACVVPLGATA